MGNMPICVDLLIVYILYFHNVCLFTDSRDVKQELNNLFFSIPMDLAIENTWLFIAGTII